MTQSTKNTAKVTSNARIGVLKIELTSVEIPHHAALIGSVMTQRRTPQLMRGRGRRLTADDADHPDDGVHRQRDRGDGRPEAEPLADHVRGAPRAKRPVADRLVLHVARHVVEAEQRDEERREPDRDEEDARAAPRGCARAACPSRDRRRLASSRPHAAASIASGVRSAAFRVSAAGPREQQRHRRAAEERQDEKDDALGAAEALRSSRCATNRISENGLTGVTVER